MMRFALLSAFLLLLNACSFLPEKSVETYRLAQMQHLQKQNNWYFEGRLALVNEKDSVSASISWKHRPEHDEIELAGPLSQGRVAISVLAESVIVDDGENRQEYRGLVDNVVSQQLGVDMPVNSLKFWVLGVNDPNLSIIELDDGFIQDGWLVKFREMQRVGAELLPKKISAEKNKTRVKLVVDQWDLS